MSTDRFGFALEFRANVNPITVIRIPIEVFIGHILPFFTFYIFKSEIVREIGRPAVPDIVVRFVRFFLAKYASDSLCCSIIPKLIS